MNERKRAWERLTGTKSPCPRWPGIQELWIQVINLLRTLLRALKEDAMSGGKSKWLLSVRRRIFWYPLKLLEWVSFWIHLLGLLGVSDFALEQKKGLHLGISSPSAPWLAQSNLWNHFGQMKSPLCMVKGERMNICMHAEGCRSADGWYEGKRSQSVAALPLSRQMMGTKGFWPNLQWYKSGITTLKLLDEVASGWAGFSSFSDCRTRKWGTGVVSSAS